MNCDGDKLQNSTNGLRCYYERIKGRYYYWKLGATACLSGIWINVAFIIYICIIYHAGLPAKKACLPRNKCPTKKEVEESSKDYDLL